MTITFRNAATAGGSSGGNLTINKPTGVVDNDMMEVVLYSEFSSTAWTLPTGWAWRVSSTGQADRLGVMWVFIAYKRASGEGASYVFTHGGTAWRSGTISAYISVITSGDPEDSTGPTGRSSTTSSWEPIATGITTSTNNDMAIFVSGNYGGSTFGVGASGYTLAGQIGGTGIMHKLYASAGATGDITGDNTSNDDKWATWHYALKEASAALTFLPKTRSLQQAVNRASNY